MLTLGLIVSILAEVSPDPLINTSGWAGCGLLGAVLSWLMFIHLPSKDKQLKEIISEKDLLLKDIIDSKDKQLNEIMSAKWQMLQQMSGDYRSDLKQIAEHCEKEMATLTNRFADDLQSLRELAVSFQQWADDQREKR